MRWLQIIVCVPFISPAFADEPPRCADIADAAARLACYDAQAKAAPPAPAPAPAPAAAAQPAPAPPPFEEPAEPVYRVEGHIVGSFKGWEKGTLVRLDNGQLWKVESDPAYYTSIPDNPKVVIERGNGYWMAIETVGRKVKVRPVLELRKKK